MARCNSTAQSLIGIFILILSIGHSKSKGFLRLSQSPNKSIYASQGDVVEIQCQYTYLSILPGVSQGSIKIKWFRLSAHGNDIRTTSCLWNSRGISYSEYSSYEKLPPTYLPMTKISSKLIISNFSDSYIGDYRCVADCGPTRVKSDYSRLANKDHFNRNTKPVLQPRYMSPSCRSLVNNFNITDTVAGDNSTTVSLGWDLIPGGSTCNNTNEEWTATLLEWDSVENIPEFDYSISEPRNVKVSNVSMSCNQCSCSITNRSLDNEKWYQFRLHVSAHNLTDSFGSPIYHYGVEEKPVIVSFTYCDINEKLWCFAQGTPKPNVRIGRSTRQTYEDRPSSSCKCASCTDALAYQTAKVSDTGIYVCEASNVLTNPRRKVSVESVIKLHIPKG